MATTKREKLTAGRIRVANVATGKGQSFLWDTDAPGFGVRLTKGCKAFVFEGRHEGRKLRVTIGDVRAWDIDKARAEARRLQTVLDQGTDPRREKAAKAEAERAADAAKAAKAERQAVTVAAAWARYVEDRRAHWGERYYTDHVNLARPGGTPAKRGKRLTTPGPLAPILARKLAELDRATVQAWLKGEAATRPAQARQAFGALRAFLLWCEDQADLKGLADPEACARRVARAELPRKGVKSDCLQREQLPAWFKAVREQRNPVLAAYLQALLLTGARREELATLRWEGVDFQWKSLTIRDKVEGERTIPLTPYVAALLAALPRRTLADGRPSPWVFSSPSSASGRLHEPRIGHNRALTAAGLPPLSLHGLRRSFGTLSEWVEIPTGIVAQIMGHKPSATAERHYRVRPLDLLRVWHTKLEAWILAEARIPVPEEPGLRLVAGGGK
jgi:integrase